MQAKGNVRIIIKKVGRIQDLTGGIKNLYYQDAGDSNTLAARGDRIVRMIEEAFDLCLEIRNMYDPID